MEETQATVTRVENENADVMDDDTDVQVASLPEHEVSPESMPLQPKKVSDESNGNLKDETSPKSEDDGKENPQDATIEPSVVDFDVKVHDDTEAGKFNNSKSHPSIPSPGSLPENGDLAPSKPLRKQRPERRKRKSTQGRTVQIEEVTNRGSHSAAQRVKLGLSLPINQYEAILVRRAIRKTPDDVSKKLFPPGGDSASSSSLEIYGDTSLGMKLSVVGGKVIVQSLTALRDGRASPAQLVGLIKRGDVLLSINGASLVNLLIEQLMNRLGPLSTPDANGVFQRRLALRLEAGGGTDLLTKSEAAQNVKQSYSATDPAGDMFSLFPMVDQLSGIPLIDHNAANMMTTTPKLALSPEKRDKNVLPPNKSAEKKPFSVNEVISLDLAAVKQRDRDQIMSEFFTWNNAYSSLMRCDSSAASTVSVQSTDSPLSKAKLVQRAHRAIMGAMALANQVENVDKGKDVRSFQSWNTTLSLYSRASTRRRYVLDAASLPLNFGKMEDEKDDGDDDSENAAGSLASGDASGAVDQVDGDELLLRLAAQDEIWRKQVIEFLQNIVDGKLVVAEEEVPTDAPVQEDSLATNDFSSFLLGENVTKILTQRKKSQALPPSDVTAVLFDLTTKLSASVPDEITAAGTHISLRSSIVPFAARKAPAPGSQVMLATHFLIEEALPAWSKTFRPLPWDQRRVLWPLDNQVLGGSTAASTLSDDDSLTVDSFSTGLNSAAKRQRQRRSLREQIEDQELDAETREETCFLLTYFFTQALLPRLKDKGTISVIQIKDYIKRFGAYLRLHTCLAYSVALKAESIIEMLLDLARHDPKHRDVIKRTSNSTSWLFYEPAMLSAVIQRLRNLHLENSSEMRQATIDLCASAYPDVQPWQVRSQCLRVSGSSEQTKALADLYYGYLTLLLHPVDGHATARQVKNLVIEWCDLSVQRVKLDGRKKPSEYKANFVAVASRASSSHSAYRRDLVHLLELSMEIGEVDLALDLANEILDHPHLSENREALAQVVAQVRLVAQQSLKPMESMWTRSLKRVLKLFRKASESRSTVVREAFNVPKELLFFIRYKLTEGTPGENLFAKEQLDLIRFLADWAEPKDVLQALACLTEVSSGYHTDVVPIVRTLLRRAGHESVSSEMSVALLKVKHARMDIEEDIDNKGASDDGAAGISNESIWQSMSNGMITIAK